MKILISCIILASNFAMASAVTLALNWKAEPQFGGFYTAEFEKIFKKNNLEVRIQEGGAGTPTIQMIANGQVEFGIVSGDELIISRERGSDVVALFAVYQDSPVGIMTHAEKNYKSLEEVYQKPGVLAQQNGLPYALFLQKKYPHAKVQIVPYLGGIGNFAANPNFSQQCFVTSEPLLAEKQNLKIKTFLVAESGFNPYTTVVVARASFVKTHPKETASLVASIKSGWEQYLKDPVPTNLKMANINHAMDIETFNKSAAAQRNLILKAGVQLGSMTESRWTTLAQQIKGIGLVKKDIKGADLILTRY